MNEDEVEGDREECRQSVESDGSRGRVWRGWGLQNLPSPFGVDPVTQLRSRCMDHHHWP